MIDKNSIERAGDFIAKKSDADDYLFKILAKDCLSTRFAENAITQHITGQNYEIDLQVAYDQKKGTASVNRLDDESLSYLIDTAQKMARLNQPDPEHVPSESAHELTEIDNFAQETANLPVEQIVADVKKCVDNAEAKQAKLAGIAEKELTDFYVLTKNGFEGFDRLSRFGLSMTMKKGEVETKVTKAVKNYKNFDVSQEIIRLNSQFDSLHKPEKLEAQKIAVILRPQAVIEFFLFLCWMMDLRSADEGVTPYTGQLGQECFGPKFNFASIMNDQDLSVPKFTEEGVPTRPIAWINKGVIENMIVSRYYAKEKEIKPAFPYNIYIEGGDTTETEMMNMVERGLIINYLWYIRPVDRKKGEITGITRDGVLYFENGEIKKSVNNLRFNEIPHETSKRILALGPSVLQDIWVKIPTILIDDFNFVDATTF